VKIFFDLDGVLFDFVGSLHSELNLSYNEKDYPYPKGIYDIFPYIEKQFNISQSKIFGILRKESFWENMPLYKKGKEFFNLVVREYGKEPIYFLSNPIIGMPESFSGKYKAVTKNFEGFSKKIILTTTGKDIVDFEDSVLIEDADKNVKLFKKGKTFLFPQPWNSNYEKVNLSLQELFEEFSKLFKKASLNEVYKMAIINNDFDAIKYLQKYIYDSNV
jgi:hypothetical protein